MPVRSSTLEQDIRRRIRRSTADLVDFASELVRIPSENPPGKGYPETARLVARRLRELGLTVQSVNPTAMAPCVLGTLGEAGRALYWSGHYDVVPAHASSQFEAVVRKSNLHGRGTADMKGGIAAKAFAAKALISSGFEPKGRLILVAVPDEETSGPRGTVALANAGVLERDALGMLTMEPTSGVVWNANRGVISARVTIRGKPAHVGLHFQGVNAFTAMLDVANEFKSLAARVSRRRTAFEIEPEPARRSILLLGGEFSGGHNFNVVPDRVTFTLDRRTNPEEDFETERKQLFQIVEQARARGIDCDIEVMQEGRSGFTEADGPLAQALASSIERVTRTRPRFELCPGVLETRHYTALGIPALAYGPGLLSVAHGPHEFVSIRKLVQAAEVYALTALQLLG